MEKISAAVQQALRIKPQKKARVFHSLAQLDRVRNMMLGLPIPKVGRGLAKDAPWGYAFSNQNPMMLEPVERELRLLLRARFYLRQNSYHDVAEWLSDKSGRKITAQGLYKIMKGRCPCNEIALPLKERMKLAFMSHAFSKEKTTYFDDLATLRELEKDY